jgi:large subunit ribosomal protein L6
MSRIGKLPIKLPQGVKVEFKSGQVKVEGPKGKLSQKLPTGIQLKVETGEVTIEPGDLEIPGRKALYGLSRTLVYNMVVGVTTGFTKELDIVGVGYRAATKGNVLQLTVGYSHQIDYEVPAGVTAKVEGNTHLVLNGPDKVLVGMVAAKIRSFKKPEPYQGKGIKYTNERINRKEGKSAGSK